MGQLLYDHEAAESMMRRTVVSLDTSTGKEIMFDRQNNSWVEYDEDIVPWTYSMAPAPRSVAQELDYFLRSAALVKHKFIWAPQDMKISHDAFEKLKSERNSRMFGRYANIIESPDVSKPAALVNNFLVVDSNDPREKIFFSMNKF